MSCRSGTEQNSEALEPNSPKAPRSSQISHTTSPDLCVLMASAWLKFCFHEVALTQEVVFQKRRFLTEWGWWEGGCGFMELVGLREDSRASS